MRIAFKTNWCMQVNRSYGDGPEYIIGSKDKISRLFDDMERDPVHFEETTQIEDRLPVRPKLSIKGGSFGFVPGKNVPIHAVASYTTSPLEEQQHTEGSGFLKKLFITGMVLFGIFVAMSIMATMSMQKGLETIEDLSNECYVVTKGGKPQTITVFGETLWFDQDGEIVIPDQREITHMDARRFERPLEYCSVVAADGIQPTI